MQKLITISLEIDRILYVLLKVSLLLKHIQPTVFSQLSQSYWSILKHNDMVHELIN